MIPATKQNFATFGQIALVEGVEPPASLPGMDFRADVMEYPATENGIGIGFATQAPRACEQDSVERHILTPELLVPGGGDMIVVVGPPKHMDEQERHPEISEFAAFRIPDGTAILFHPGVWHWAPFAVESTITLTVAFRKGTSASDAHVCELPEALTFSI